MAETRKLGKYEIIRELGRGGFGVVYEAKDTILGRHVAIKILHGQLSVDPDFLERFEQEARLAAQLEHPNLVPVYDFGQLEGHNFISMGFMRGGSLKDRLIEHGPFDPYRAKKALEDVLEGLSIIHENKIVHRDLKPANILFDQYDVARLSDLGFAKALHSEQSRNFSASGGIVGTAAYMAPEVWRGAEASELSDIYSLGCIIYEMLTGIVLFDGNTAAESMTKHLIDGPVFTVDLPKPWQALIEKCIAKDPAERYQSAKAVLEDLRFGLFDAPAERANEYVLDVTDESSGGETERTGSYEISTSHEDEAVDTLVSQQEFPNKLSENVEDVEYQDSGYVWKEEAFITLSDTSSNRLKAHILKRAWILPFILIIIIIGLVGLLISLPRLLKNEKPLLAKQSQSASLSVESTATNTATHALTETAIVSKTTELLKTATSMPTLPPVIGGSQVISLANVTQIEELARIGRGSIQEVQYSPDGSLLAVGSSIGVFLYDAFTLEEKIFIEDSAYLRTVSWLPDSKRIVSGNSDGEVKIWNVEDGSLLNLLSGHTDGVNSVSCSPDGKRIVSGSDDKTVRIWDADNGRLLHTLKGHSDFVLGVRFSPDGKTLASKEQWDSVLIWDAENGDYLYKTYQTSSGDVNYSPDGKQIISGHYNGELIIWNALNGLHLTRLRGHTGSVNSASYSPDGKRIVSGSYDNTLRIWDAKSGDLLNTLEGHTSSVINVAYSPDGKLIVSASYDAVRIWDAESGELLHTLTGYIGSVYSVSYSPDGKRIVSGSGDRTIRIWDASDGSLINTLIGHTDDVNSVSYSPDGKRIVSASYNAVRIWDAESGELLHTLNCYSRYYVYSVSYSSDGKRIVSGSADAVRIWDAESGELLHTLTGPKGSVISVGLSPDGKLIVSGSYDAVRIWDAESGSLLHTLTGHEGSVYSVVFSPDGKLIVSGSYDAVRIWDAESGSLLHTLTGHRGSVDNVSFSSDGKSLISSSSDGTIRIWGIP